MRIESGTTATGVNMNGWLNGVEQARDTAVSGGSVVEGRGSAGVGGAGLSFLDAAAGADSRTQLTQACCPARNRGGGMDNRQVASSLIALISQLLALLQRLLGQGKPPEYRTSDGASLSGNAVKPKGNEMKDVGGRQAVPMDGPNGFLWKPESDSDGKLVVLLPKDVTADAQKVVIKDSNGKVLDSPGRTGEFGDGRGIYRFSKPGESYPEGAIVEVTLKDGSVRQYQVGDPSKRHD